MREENLYKMWIIIGIAGFIFTGALALRFGYSWLLSGAGVLALVLITLGDYTLRDFKRRNKNENGKDSQRRKLS